MSVSVPRFKGLPSREELLSVLERDGCVVIENLVDAERVADMREGFYESMAKVAPKFDPNDKKTWVANNLPPSTRGLYQHNGFSCQEYAMKGRLECKPVFERLYGTGKLLTSLDATSFQQCPLAFRYASLEDWEARHTSENMHLDQTSSSGFRCVQGGLALSDQPVDSRVFVCIPGSHVYHERIMAMEQECQIDVMTELMNELRGLERMGDGGDKKEIQKLKCKIKRVKVLAQSKYNKSEWLVLSKKHLSVLKPEMKCVRVPLKEGDFVLWRSDLAHTSAPPCRTMDKDVVRLQLFVCMLPVPECEETKKAQMAIREKAYRDSRTTKHSPDIVRLFNKQARVYGEGPEYGILSPFMDLPREARQLYGLEEYD